jgi:hypothetical protein
MTMSRRGAAIALLALAGLLGAACSPTTTAADPAPEGTGTVAGGEAGVAPTPEAELPEAPAEPDYPDTAEEYAKAVMAALDADEWDRFGDLTTPETFDQLVELPASVDDDWSFHRCDGAAGSSYCSFINDDGDALAIRISHALLGEPHAATDVVLDSTEYPHDGITYVKEFISAWQFGNTVRMHKLSSASVIAKLPAAPTTTVTYPAPTCCGGGLLQVKAVWNGSTKVFDVRNTDLGGPNAIVDYTLELGFTS